MYKFFFVNFFLYYDFLYFTVIFNTTCYLCVLGLSLTIGASLQNVIKVNSSEDVDREREPSNVKHRVRFCFTYKRCSMVAITLILNGDNYHRDNFVVC